MITKLEDGEMKMFSMGRLPLETPAGIVDGTVPALLYRGTVYQFIEMIDELTTCWWNINTGEIEYLQGSL